MQLLTCAKPWWAPRGTPRQCGVASRGAGDRPRACGHAESSSVWRSFSRRTWFSATTVSLQAADKGPQDWPSCPGTSLVSRGADSPPRRRLVWFVALRFRRLAWSGVTGGAPRQTLAASAARCAARSTRSCEPQRQRLPSSPSCACSRVGRGSAAGFGAAVPPLSSPCRRCSSRTAPPALR